MQHCPLTAGTVAIILSPWPDLGFRPCGRARNRTAPDRVTEVDEDTASCIWELPFCWMVLGSSIHISDHTSYRHSGKRIPEPPARVRRPRSQQAGAARQRRSETQNQPRRPGQARRGGLRDPRPAGSSRGPVRGSKPAGLRAARRVLVRRRLTQPVCGRRAPGGTGDCSRPRGGARGTGRRADGGRGTPRAGCPAIPAIPARAGGARGTRRPSGAGRRARCRVSPGSAAGGREPLRRGDLRGPRAEQEVSRGARGGLSSSSSPALSPRGPAWRPPRRPRLAEPALPGAASPRTRSHGRAEDEQRQRWAAGPRANSVKVSRTRTGTSGPKPRDSGLLSVSAHLGSPKALTPKGRLLPLTPIKPHHAHSTVPPRAGPPGERGAPEDEEPAWREGQPTRRAPQS